MRRSLIPAVLVTAILALGGCILEGDNKGESNHPPERPSAVSPANMAEGAESMENRAIISGHGCYLGINVEGIAITRKAIDGCLLR